MLIMLQTTSVCISQVSLGGIDTVQSKELYELATAEYGVKVIRYRDDNGVYKCKAFNEDIVKRKQTLALSGVGSHGKMELLNAPLVQLLIQLVL